MSEDPRWQRALKLLRQAAAAQGRGDSDGMVRAFESYPNTLDSLAVDPAVACNQRRHAAKLLDDMEALFSAHLPALLHRLAELRDAKTDADERAELDAMLTRATEQMPAASSARH
jgi:hypothetical protein